MKRNWMSILYCGMGTLIGLLPGLMVCPVDGLQGAMRCWETAKIMAILGAVILVIGIMLAFCQNMKKKIGLHGFTLLLSGIGFLVPLKLIGGCMESTMPCHAVAFPVLYGMLTIMMGISFVGLLHDIGGLQKGRILFQK